MTKKCKPKAKKNVPKKDIPSFAQRISKFFPIGIIAFAGVVALASGHIEKPSQEPFEWPVAYEEVVKPTEPVIVAEAPTEEVKQEEAPSVTEPGIEWPVVAEPVPERHEAEPVAPTHPVARVGTEQEIAPPVVTPTPPEVVAYDAVIDTVITVTPKPEPEKKEVKVKKKKNTKKAKKTVKQTTANEDFMANFTRGMY